MNCDFVENVQKKLFFYRRETEVQTCGMTWLELFGKSVVKQIVYPITTPYFTIKSILLLPCFCVSFPPFHFSLLHSSSFIPSSSPSSPCQLKHMAEVTCCNSLPSDFPWFSVCSIHHSHGCHSCRSPQQQRRVLG